MATLTASMILSPKLKPSSEQQASSYIYTRSRKSKKNQTLVPVARLFGPAIFEASKLKVLFLGVDEKKHPGNLPRTYTLTHSDITSKITLAISQTINNSQIQGWYNKLQRDEVIAEWKKVQGKMSLHVHCHISGGHFLLDMFARLRFFIFSKELPVVLNAFVHGDVHLFSHYPELEESLVWVYFHSNLPEFNRVECWGPLREAAAPSSGALSADQKQEQEEKHKQETPPKINWKIPQTCIEDCDCCFPTMSSIPWLQHTFIQTSDETHQSLPEQQ
ncbi:hypothetical protein AgCh_019926 [Apium graveolens]